MANKFEERYVLPVMANMDDATRNIVWYMFYQTYRIHPGKAFRFKSNNIKMCHLEHLYHILIQIYSGKNKKPGIEYVATDCDNEPKRNTADSGKESKQNIISVKINPGMESKYAQIQQEMSVVPMLTVSRMCVHLKHMAAVCDITSNAETPKIPRQKFGAFIRDALHEFCGR